MLKVIVIFIFSDLLPPKSIDVKLQGGTLDFAS